MLEGIPINQYREVEVTIGPNLNDNKPIDKNAWPELPMPRDSHMLPEHSQQLLRAARSGRTIKPPAPVEDDNEMKDEEEESKEVQVGFTVKKYVKVARHLETPEPEYLAKRRKGLPSQYVNGQVAPTPFRETKVKKLDAEGNVAIYKVLVPEGQAVEGEVQPTDAAIEVVPATAAPGTVVEGVGVVNAEGIVVANDVLHQTPPRRRIIPSKKKRGHPGRGRRRVNFVEGDKSQETPTLNANGDVLPGSSLKREEGSAAPSDGGDTPMADAGGEDEEGSGEEGSEDEDQDMEHASTPTTPSKLSAAPTSVPTSVPTIDTADTMSVEPTPALDAPAPAPAPEEAVPVAAENSLPSLPPLAPETIEPAAESSAEPVEPDEKREASSSPDLLMSNTSHNQQDSLDQISTSVPTTDIEITEVVPTETVVVEETSAIMPDLAADSAAEPEIVAPEPPSPTESETAPENVTTFEAAEVKEPAVVPSAPPSEPDLLGSLERQLEKDSEDMAGS